MDVLFSLFYCVFKFTVTIHWSQARLVQLFQILYIFFSDIYVDLLADVPVLDRIMSISPDRTGNIRSLPAAKFCGGLLVISTKSVCVCVENRFDCEEKGIEEREETKQEMESKRHEGTNIGISLRQRKE
jgi:hypothetical protein